MHRIICILNQILSCPRLLDCGFKFYPSGKKAIPHMVQPSGVELIFTEFDKID